MKQARFNKIVASFLVMGMAFSLVGCSDQESSTNDSNKNISTGLVKINPSKNLPNVKNYQKAKTHTAKIKVINQAFAENDISSLAYLNKTKPTNLLNLILNALVFQNYYVHYLTRSQSTDDISNCISNCKKCSNNVKKILQGISFKDTKNLQDYNALSTEVKRAINTANQYGY